MSKLVPNVVDTARLFRTGKWTGTFGANHTSITLTSPYLGLEINKHEAHGRFFADKAMIERGGGPYFLQWYKERFSGRLSALAEQLARVRIQDIEAKDLFSYRTCGFFIEPNHAGRFTPIALQLVQKARIFAIADEALEQTIGEIV